MKYSFMSFSCPELSLDEMLKLAADLGYDGIEPRLSAKHAHGIEADISAAARAEVRKRVEEGSIALCCLATSCKYADPASVEENVQETLRVIDLAADVGAPSMRVFGGSIPAGIEREAAIDTVAAALRSVADRAAERSVTVCMETHDDWCDPRHVAEVMRRVDHPAIAVNWDIMHPIRRGGVTMTQAFEVLSDWTKHVHFHDGKSTGASLTLVPVGQGEIDHRCAVGLLLKSGYDGYLSGEWINWESYHTHLPRDLATMKSYEQSGG